MEEEIYNKYKLAGTIIAQVFLDVRRSNIVKPGAKIIDIVNFIEDGIKKKGGTCAFPLNIDINEIAAHYTSPIDDQTVIPEPKEGYLLVKLDGGVSIDGYLSDHAITINLGSEKHDVFYEAAHSALIKAISTIKPGVKINSLGELIEKEIKSFNLKPISNLSGHKLKQYDLHSGSTIPNIETSTRHSASFQEGDVFAIEPFTTNGAGFVINQKIITIYSLNKSKIKNAPRQINDALATIFKTTNLLPFSPRWIPSVSENILKRLISLRAVHGYPVLMDAKRGPVAQAEHTVIVTSDGAEITTLIS
ncbi:MAG: type II methionyl aminopeptidase [Candidatus Lokiarchaeota archaeon]|nr:type II methionyl aminopeptidase [Candidatus Lokiarchaeota archaeon]